MRLSDIASQLLEYRAADSEAAELDKLLLRIYENPSLVAYLEQVGGNGDYTEITFLDLPANEVESVKKLIGLGDIEVLRFKVNGWPRVGFRFNLKQVSEN